MKYAALLILESSYSISEAAFMVGFKAPKYFTKCFKEEFGIPPTTLKKEARAMGMAKVLKTYQIKVAP